MTLEKENKTYELIRTLHLEENTTDLSIGDISHIDDIYIRWDVINDGRVLGVDERLTFDMSDTMFDGKLMQSRNRHFGSVEMR